MVVTGYSFQQLDGDRVGMFSGGQHIASLYLDYRKKIDALVLYSGTSAEDELAAIRIVAAQALRELGQTATMDCDQLLEVLSQHKIACIFDAVESLTEALTTAIASERVTVPVQFQLGKPSGDRHLRRVTFIVESPARFRVWHNLHRPGPDGDFDIVPGYHPCMNGRLSLGLVNGETDGFVTGLAIDSVYAPEGSAIKQSFLTSWDGPKHPIYCAGQKIELDVSEALLLSPEGINELVEILVALLELENTYLPVSGGFRGPYEDSRVVAHQAGIRTSSKKGEARGSEGHCVWTYHVLKSEGELEAAHIPPWFLAEGWLDVYARFSLIPSE